MDIIKIIDGKVNIDNDFLLQFITLIALQEENYFSSVLPNYLRKQNNRRCFENEKYKREIWRIENLKDVKIVDNIKLG